MRHQQLTDELQEKAILYAAGALDEDERREYERHLDEDTCTVCRGEVRESEAAAQSLTITLPMQTPSESVKRRLIERAEAASLTGRRRQPPNVQSRPSDGVAGSPLLLPLCWQRCSSIRIPYCGRKCNR